MPNQPPAINNKASASADMAKAKNCTACHGYDGRGQQEIGASNLADAIWLKSDGSPQAILSQVKNPQHGMMPAWVDRLDEDTIRALTVYVHSLGGGE